MTDQELLDLVRYAIKPINLDPEDLEDLKQELCARLVKYLKDNEAKNIKALARRFAFVISSDIRRMEDRRRNLLRAIDNSEPWNRSSEFWVDDWYPPHKDAKEFAPFACRGARVMTCKEHGGRLNVIEDSVLALLFRPSFKTRRKTKQIMKHRVKNMPHTRLYSKGKSF